MSVRKSIQNIFSRNEMKNEPYIGFLMLILDHANHISSMKFKYESFLNCVVINRLGHLIIDY